MNAKLFQEIGYLKDNGAWLSLMKEKNSTGTLTIANPTGSKSGTTWERKKIKLGKDLANADFTSKFKGKNAGYLPPFLGKIKKFQLKPNEKRWEGVWVYRSEADPDNTDPIVEKVQKGYLGVILAANDTNRAGGSEGTIGITVSSVGLNTLLQSMSPQIGNSGTCMVFANTENGWILLSHSDQGIIPHEHQGDDDLFLKSLSAWDQMADPKAGYLGSLLKNLGKEDFTKSRMVQFPVRDSSGKSMSWRCNMRPMGGEGRPDWVVATLISENELFEIPRKGFRTLLVSSGVALFASLGICFAIALFISRPIESFSQDAKNMGELILENRAPTKSFIREIRHLEKSMNEMHMGLKSFSKYVPADLVKQLLISGIEAKPGGRKTEITILFADLEGFTTLSEKLPPEQLVRIICQYLNLGTQAVISENGTVDKYIGDAVMAFWNAPIAVENHEISACRAALKLKTSVFEYFKQEKDMAGNSTKVRVGIHRGTAIVGNFGSKSRLNYTALGDNVNLASRLEGIGKFYGTSILITRQVHLATKNLFVVRSVDLVAVKGKDQGVYIIELLAEKETATPELQELVRLTSMAWALYRSREFQAAYSAYQDLSKAFPDDKLALVMAERCNRLAANPPPDSWNGVYHAETK